MPGNRRMFVFTRREFIKMSMASAAALGFSPLIRWPKLAGADEPHTMKPAVVWLEGQDCAGCSESVITHQDIKSVILDVVGIQYHETIMAAAGEVAEDHLDATISGGGYVLVVEGSLPAADTRYMEVPQGHALEDTLVDAANNAVAILAIGACATYGGIPRAGVTDGQGVGFFLDKHSIVKPLINLPGCPVHPYWFVDTVVTFLGGTVPSCDGEGRPLKYYGATVHDNCPRKRYYNRDRFLQDWNSTAQRKYCLLKKGCKGPWTHADCPITKWNQGVNWCIGNNAPCSGCTEPAFYADLGSVYGPLEKP